MAFILHTTQSISRSGVHILTMRQLIWAAISAACVLVLLAFGAGILIGKVTASPTIVAQTAPPKDPAQERFTFDRLGKVSGRLVKLETDAHALVRKIAALETLQTRLAGLDDTKAGALPNSTRGSAVGGKVMAPQGCAVDLKADTTKSMENAEKALACLESVLSKVESAAAKQSVAYMAMPVGQPVNSTRIGSGFGDRIDPFNGRLSFHSGIDFDAPIGTPIRSAGGGRVKTASWVNELGFVVEIEHGNGLMTRYAHTSKMYVKPGDIVTPGQLIAEVGSTGRSTGPHLHFEILHNGRFVNPAPYLSIGAQIPNV